jgi:hypothetical protein
VSSPVSVWSILRGAFRSRSGKLAALLATTPFWKLIYHSIDALGNVRMIAEGTRTVLSFLASWWGALSLMVLGFVLLWLQVQKQIELVKNAAVITPVDPTMFPTGDSLQPETLIGLFRTNDKLALPYLGQTMTVTGIVDKTYFQGLKQDKNSVVLKRSPNTNVVVHLADKYSYIAYGMPYGGQATVSGEIIAIDSSSVTLNECEIIEVKPPLEG